MSRHSIVLVGLSEEAEDAWRPWVGADPRAYFLLAQRVTWGVTQPDLVRVDVARALDELERSFPECGPGQVLLACLSRANDPARAARALERARALLPAGHPKAGLLPTADEWAARTLPQRLDEVVPGRVWRTSSPVVMAGTPLPGWSTATVLRLDDGRLVIVNPVDLEPVVLEALRALGPVGWVAVQGRGHSRFVEPCRKLFPEARFLGTAGHAKHPASAGVRFDGVLDDPGPDWPDEVQRLHVRGSQLDEVLLLHRPTGLLVMQDLFQTPADPEGDFAGRVYRHAFGVDGRYGFLAYQPLLWNDLPTFQAGLRAVVAAAPTRIAGAHSRTRPLEGSEVAGAMAALEGIASWTAWEHRGWLARYFWNQPTFLRDLVRYAWKMRSP